jgi:hypothetical protein
MHLIRSSIVKILLCDMLDKDVQVAHPNVQISFASICGVLTYVFLPYFTASIVEMKNNGELPLTNLVFSKSTSIYVFLSVYDL